jgi:hypothetical protein
MKACKDQDNASTTTRASSLFSFRKPFPTHLVKAEAEAEAEAAKKSQMEKHQHSKRFSKLLPLPYAICSALVRQEERKREKTAAARSLQVDKYLAAEEVARRSQLKLFTFENNMGGARGGPNNAVARAIRIYYGEPYTDAELKLFAQRIFDILRYAVEAVLLHVAEEAKKVELGSENASFHARAVVKLLQEEGDYEKAYRCRAKRGACAAPEFQTAVSCLMEDPVFLLHLEDRTSLFTSGHYEHR